MWYRVFCRSAAEVSSTELLAGRLDLSIAPLPGLIAQQIASGSVRALGIASAQRTPQLGAGTRVEAHQPDAIRREPAAVARAAERLCRRRDDPEDRPDAQTDRADTGRTIEGRQVTELPLGQARNFQGMWATVPGTVPPVLVPSIA